MKKALVVFLVLALVLGAIFLVRKPEREERVKEPQVEERVVKEAREELVRAFNLTEPERHTLTINGKEHSFLLARYDPPYFHTRLLARREEADLSTPEGTNLALWSASGRDRDWYLSLQDEGAREFLLEWDRETGGKILEERYRGDPLPDPLKTGDYHKFIYRVDLEYQGQKYALIQVRLVWAGEVCDWPAFKTFVKQGDAWLVTRDLKDHPVERLVALKSYEQLREILKEGSWAVR